jgi:dTDP-4-amino-4,6-dideoxygalactose transaminase
LGYSKGDFPVAEGVAAEVISLPMYPQLTSVMQMRVADEISRFSVTRGTTKPNRNRTEMVFER